jgi:spermidine synthase
MIEHVGHEFMEEFFCCCESVLAEDGVLVLQVVLSHFLFDYIVLVAKCPSLCHSFVGLI